MESYEIERQLLISELYAAVAKVFPGDRGRDQRYAMYTAIERELAK